MTLEVFEKRSSFQSREGQALTEQVKPINEERSSSTTAYHEKSAYSQDRIMVRTEEAWVHDELNNGPLLNMHTYHHHRSPENVE